MFLEGAELTVDFAFKIGAVQEAVLRQAFMRHGHYIDQVLWSIVESDRRQAMMACGSRVQIH